MARARCGVLIFSAISASLFRDLCVKSFLLNQPKLDRAARRAACRVCANILSLCKRELLDYHRLERRRCSGF
jgi:hypothetical protein